MLAAFGLLAACSSEDVAARQAKFQAALAQVPAYEAKAKEDLTKFSSGAITDVKLVGQDFCAVASMLHGTFGVAAPLLTADPKVFASEQAAMAIVEVACAVLDKADPATPVPTLLTATQQVIGAVPTIKEAVATIGG